MQLSKMENNKELEAKTMRVSAEFIKWVEEIKEQFNKIRGFRPSDSDITTNIKRQFKGQFIV